MSFTFAKRGIAPGVLGLLLAGVGFGASPPPAEIQAQARTENWKSIEKASEKLRELRTISGKLSLSGEALDASTRTHVSSRDGHANRLSLVREHVNAAGKILAELQRMHPELAPWQQQAVDAITPIAARVATHTQAAIVHLNERPHARFVPEYTNHLEGIADHSLSMKETVGKFLDFAEARSKAQALETALEIDRS
ncbi:MAG TPA: hypothetical protein VMM16_01090 [Verrucomicrobiae bacterium]|nr:hypothetical protein [Verrucomicrobiae bacterium]